MKPTRPLAPPPAGPSPLQSLLALAAQALQAGRLEEAAQRCEQALAIDERSADAHFLRAAAATRAGDFARAEQAFARTVTLQPAHAPAWSNRGAVLRKLGRPQDAVGCFEAALRLQPTHVESHFNLGNVLRDLRRPADALAAYRRAAQLAPDRAVIHAALAATLVDAGDARAGLAAADHALRLDPGLARAWEARGHALVALRQYAAALPCFDALIAANPQDAEAHAQRGAVLLAAHRVDEACAALDRALALAPAHVEACENRAQAAARAKRHDEAVAFYARLRQLAPDHPAVDGLLLHAKMLAADWDGVDALAEEITRKLALGIPAAEPFGHQGIATSEAELQACARLFAAREHPHRSVELPPKAASTGGRITIGYVCGEFREHATSILLAGVWEHHDRTRFRTIAFDNGGADGSAYRARIEGAFEEMIDIRALDDTAVAALVRQRGVDVLVNLNGWYGEGRTDLFALRPCAVQVNYLGFPGTMGAPYFDYLVADRSVVPHASRSFYDEQVVWLPHSYQATDNRREADPTPVTRAGEGLPEDAFVFCCFNNTYKITPAWFAGWMRILARAPASVLWLLQDDDRVAARLRGHAQAAGIDPARIVFARRAPPARHLARHVLADLVLDTLPYNAHTTASDALWSGVPVLTCEGTTFPGRVAASLLRALGLDALVTSGAEAYEQAAVRLAHDREGLAALREGLRGARATSPLFDTARFTRHLEDAFATMVRLERDGFTPRHFEVPASDTPISSPPPRQPGHG